MTLQFDRIQVSPGSNITLGAKADPGSQVFIRVVDKSVLLLSDKNDITKDLVSFFVCLFLCFVTLKRKTIDMSLYNNAFNIEV